MSSRVGVASDQLCYIPCNFCNIVLAVSVPCSSLLETVTVRCGHCSTLWSVNMAAAFNAPPSSATTTATASSPSQDPHPRHHPYQSNGYNMGCKVDDAMGSSSRYYNNKIGMRTAPAATNYPTNPVEERVVVNRPPEKRQRVPSAYNQFIKEEIQRIKANNPDISHKEAFSTAAKNWAHFPHIHFGLMLETNDQPKLIE